MGQVKKHYQEWVEQSYPPASPTGEWVDMPKEKWTAEFEKFIDALLTKKTVTNAESNGESDEQNI